MKNFPKLLFLITVVLLAACKDDDKVTISPSKIKVKTLKVVTAVKNDAAAITKTDFFVAGDHLEFQYTTQTGASGTFTADMDEDAAWEAVSKELYYSDLYPQGKDPQLFQVEFGNKSLTTDQSSKSKFHAAQYLKGDAYVQPTTAYIMADSIVNQHIQVIVKIVKSSNWPESAEFESIMNKDALKIHTSGGDKITPLYDKSQSGRVVYSAVVPVGMVPASGNALFTINGLSASSYQLIAGAAPEANQTLVVTAIFDNTALSTITAITKDVWDTAEGTLYGYPLIEEIATKEDLAAFALTVSSYADYTDKSVRLMNDLDLEGEYVMPIGTFAEPFNGTFLGENHTLKNLYIKSDEPYTGLFAAVGVNGTVKDLTVRDSRAESTGNYVGLLAGSNYGHIIDCRAVNGNSTGSSYVGGLVGYNDGAIVACLQEQVAVNTYRQEGAIAGGLAGYNYRKTIASRSIPHQVNAATRASKNHYGALIGENATVGVIDRCSWTYEGLPAVGYTLVEVANSTATEMNQAIADYNTGKQVGDARYCSFRW